MSYLGPRSFATAPLTKNNLAYLNNKLSQSQIDTTNTSLTLSSSSSSSPEEEELSISTPLSTISSSSSLVELIDNQYHDSADQADVEDDNCTVIISNNNTIMENNSESVNSSSASLSTIKDLPVKPLLLRKKSGELIKSSLKFPSLKRSNSMPNTNKNVRFANRLENIKFFDKLEKPIAVSNESSPLHSPSLRPTWEFDSSDEESDSSDDASQYEKWEILQNDVPYNSGFLNFGKFNTCKPIILESLKLNSTGNSLIGFVYVQNLGYEKKILIKLTVDNWKSFIEIDTSNYISSNHIFKYSNTDNSYDKFSFIIKLDSLCHFKPSSLNLNFCINYEVNGVQYWDNNNSKNYSVLLGKAHKRESRRKPKKLNDLDEIKFKLKTNYNFNDSFSSPSKINSTNFQPKQSEHFLLKRGKSETALSDLNKSSTRTSTPIHSITRASCTGFNGNISIPRTSYTTFSSPVMHRLESFNYPASRSALINSNAPTSTSIHNISNDNQYYNKIIENFCFFGTTNKLSSGEVGGPSFDL